MSEWSQAIVSQVGIRSISLMTSIVWVFSSAVVSALRVFSTAVSALWVFSVSSSVNTVGVHSSSVKYSSVNIVGVQYSSVTTAGVQCSSVRPLSLPWVFNAAVPDHCHYRVCSMQPCQTTVTTVCVQCSRVRPLSLPCVFSAAVSDHCHCRWCSVQPCQTAVRGSLLALWVSRIVVRLVSVWIGRCRWQLSDGCPR